MNRRTQIPAPFKATRRDAVGLALGALSVAVLPSTAQATPEEVTASVAETFGAGAIADGRIIITVPKLAETGNSVPLTVAVESPMTEADHVRRIAVFAEQNPRPKVCEVFLSPASGVAEIETNIRLSGTQEILVVAEMSDGSLWKARQQVRVVVGACSTLSARF